MHSIVEIIVDVADQQNNFHLKKFEESFSDSLGSIHLALVMGKNKSDSVTSHAATASLI